MQSQDGSQVEYVVKVAFAHPLLQEIHELKPGFHRLESKPGGLGLDFIRGNLADRKEFVPLPFSAPGPDNDLNEKLDHSVQRAMADETALPARLRGALGSESGAKDKIFGFLPGNGIHDIHMNQGNDAASRRTMVSGRTAASSSTSREGTSGSRSS